MRKFNTASVLKAPYLTLSSQEAGIRQFVKRTRQRTSVLVANSDRLETDINDSTSNYAEQSNANSKIQITTSDSVSKDDGLQSSADTELNPQRAGVLGKLAGSTNLNGELSSSNLKPTLKRSPLTAREKLRAARVLSRYTEPKTSKPLLGSKLLEALKESDKGKRRPGLPEAPTNMLDDSKRGMPKQGLTFDFPGGIDALVIAFSFVFISSVMFATTYLVWKVGAIHFNEN
ncbi:hypothetical protein Leryth_021538 [Lithospermum erythrorhizon]|nr:hypothetical protein Leryth_021538 [Lithospermum erythrorhizon]